MRLSAILGQRTTKVWQCTASALDCSKRKILKIVSMFLIGFYWIGVRLSWEPDKLYFVYCTRLHLQWIELWIDITEGICFIVFTPMRSQCGRTVPVGYFSENRSLTHCPNETTSAQLKGTHLQGKAIWQCLNETYSWSPSRWHFQS